MYDQADKNFDAVTVCALSTEAMPEDDRFDDDKYWYTEDDLREHFGADVYELMTA